MKNWIGFALGCCLTVACVGASPKADDAQVKKLLCETSGCNGELCHEKGKKMISPCVVLPQHKCLPKSKCEVQANGKCGWTQTEEYRTCLKEFLPK